MATVVELPRLSDTMEEGVVAKWRVQVGDKVKRGQVIAEIETDKATMEFESFDAGTVLALVAKEGQTLPLGAPIAVLGQPGEDANAALAARGSAPAPAAAPAPAPAPAQQAKAAAQAEAKAQQAVVEAVAPAPAPAPAPAAVERVQIDPGDRRIAASPLARRLVREHGLDLAAITGSGPHGRIVKADVDRAVAEGTGKLAGAAATTAGKLGVPTDEVDAWGRPYVSRPSETVKMSQMRKTIARRMTQAKQEIPHYYLTVAVDMENATKLRAELNMAIDGNKVSFNDMIIKAVARSLRDYPDMNASYVDGQVIKHGDVHVGVAVALDEGLVVPVVRYADQKSLEAIAAEVRSLGKRAKSKQLKPNEMSGSTFSISNLGMFGIETFAAVVNPGEGGILAVGLIEPKAVVVDGQIAIRKRMNITISGDHRVSDGALGANWLTRVKTYLETPIKLYSDPQPVGSSVAPA
ncbi:dihydrolipoamide acetyltransferase family protein [Nannocystaceae bacterium ST9]